MTANKREKDERYMSQAEIDYGKLDAVGQRTFREDMNAEDFRAVIYGNSAYSGMVKDMKIPSDREAVLYCAYALLLEFGAAANTTGITWGELLPLVKSIFHIWFRKELINYQRWKEGRFDYGHNAEERKEFQEWFIAKAIADEEARKAQEGQNHAS